MNILIKLTSIVALIIAPHLPKTAPFSASKADQKPTKELVINTIETTEKTTR